MCAYTYTHTAAAIYKLIGSLRQTILHGLHADCKWVCLLDAWPFSFTLYIFSGDSPSLNVRQYRIWCSPHESWLHSAIMYRYDLTQKNGKLLSTLSSDFQRDGDLRAGITQVSLSVHHKTACSIE